MTQCPWPARLAHLICGLAALALAGLCLYEVSQIGFPDGHLTDYDRARRIVLLVFAPLAGVAGLWFGTLGLRARRPSRRTLIVSYALVVVILAASWLVDHLCWINLDHGQGG